MVYNYLMIQEARLASTDFAVFAIHGGKIELGTSRIAKSIAREDLSFYSFEGESGASHIPSELYNEPRALELASKVETIISIHGEKNTEESFVMIGGLNKGLAKQIENRLKEVGFTPKEAPEGLNANNPENICNTGKSEKGVQIEISRKLRKELWESEELLKKFVDAVRQAILA